MNVATFGGVYTDGAQREVLREIISLIHRDVKEASRGA